MRLCSAAFLLFLLSVAMPWEPAAATPAEALIVRVDPQMAGRAAANPFLVPSLERALDLVAQLRRREPGAAIVVELAPGVHRLTRPLRIGPEHGGTSAAPLILRGAPGGGSRILGSQRVEPVGMALPADLAARIPADARHRVRLYRLPAAAAAAPTIARTRLLLGPVETPAVAVYDLEGALSPARWPKEGWARVVPGEKPPEFILSGDRPQRWLGEPDFWAEGYWRWDWLFETLPVTRIDAATHRLRLSQLPYEGIKAGARIRIFHALSELDSPGEWWRDQARGLLLAWPRDDGNPALEIAVADTLISVEKASHVHFENLVLEHARGDLLRVEGGEDVVVADSRLAWSAGRGAVFEGARDSGLLRCDVEDIDRVAVRLVGGDRPSLTPGHLFLRDSRVARWALRTRTQTPAVQIDGVGAIVAGNYFHDAVDGAVQMRGNDHEIVGNEISHLLAGASDDGAVYAGRDWTARGTLIAGNFLHDIRAEPGAEVKGVYLDDEASGFTVRDNLFLRVDQAVFIGGGRDNRVERNLFVGPGIAIHVDSRGETWAARAISDPASELRRAYAAMPVTSDLWRVRYSGLAEVLADRPQVAKDNVLTDNVLAFGATFDFSDGGRSIEQIVGNNIGPDGLRLGSGADLAALASRSVDPADFSSLEDGSGRKLFRLDAGALRRSLILRAGRFDRNR